MPLSVDQPSKIIVSSSTGGLIKVSIVNTMETKIVRINQTAANNVTVAGAIGAGPAGATGAAGPTGAQGPAGAQGDTGPAGAQGPAGTNGTDGTNGTNGTDGTNGTNGVDGTDGVDGGNPVLTSAITITNNDAAFAHMSSPIASGTSLETVVRDILEKYNITSISLQNVSRALQNTDGSYASFVNDTNGETVEVGQGIKIQGFDYNIGDNTQTADTSVVFYENNSVLESGFSDDNAAKILATTITRDLTTQSTRSYKVTAIDDGSGSNNTITSGSMSFRWYFRVRIGSSTSTAIASDNEAAALWAQLTAPFDGLVSQGDFQTSGDAGMDTQGKYTWIAYPNAWGAPNQILLQGVTDVLSDFESPVNYNLTNDYGVTTSYRFYRSTYDDAFAVGQTLKVDF